MDNNKTILVAVNDLFSTPRYETPCWRRLHARSGADAGRSEKIKSTPSAVILDMNDDKLDALQALGHKHGSLSPTRFQLGICQP